MKALVLGARGMLGQDLVKILAPEYEIIPWDLAEIDITREKETLEKIVKVRPQVIINCAAYTNVDQCETHRDQAFLVNAEGTKHVALASYTVKARFVHLSTDYVFDGTASIPYREDNSPNPMSVYGQSKLQGEIYVRKIGGDHLIIRTAWLYGPRGKNFVEAILSQAAEGKQIRVVNDQQGSPTFTRDLSQAIKGLLPITEQGIFHLTNSGSCTWFEFALHILEESGFKGNEVRPISSKELGRPAKRPAYSILDNSRYEQISENKMRSWQEALKEYFNSRVKG
ncbi:MAG: dTDP-4-dehydrorhamnose reductase [Deltaproteobacteria bacterium]|nr:dTDP-4-dehydrorhamnose reductase [Deltaproteobacteria bacterium]